MTSTAPPVIFHEKKHIDAGDPHVHKPLIPVIPDLRFESSYVRSVRRFVEVERVGVAPAEEKVADAELLKHALAEDLFAEGDEGGDADARGELASPERGVVAPPRPSEIIRVQWKSVIWVTVRDQVISPLVQGTLWALASYYITPFSSQLGSRMGTYVHQSLPSKEGNGISWLRDWAKKIGFSSNNSPSARTYNSSRY